MADDSAALGDALRIGRRRPAAGVRRDDEVEADALVLSQALALMRRAAGEGFAPGDSAAPSPDDALLEWCRSVGTDYLDRSVPDLSDRVRDSLLLVTELGRLARRSAELRLLASAALAAWRRSPVRDADRDEYNGLVLESSRLRRRVVELVEALAEAGAPDDLGGTVPPGTPDPGDQ